MKLFLSFHQFSEKGNFKHLTRDVSNQSEKEEPFSKKAMIEIVIDCFG